MATTISVAGTDRTAYLKDATLSYTEDLGVRNTLTCTFVDPAGAWLPLRGQEVIFHHNTEGDLFGGYIGSVRWRKIAGEGDTLFADVTCVHFEWMFSRRHCWAHTYTGNYFGEIVRDLVENSIGVGPFSSTDDAFTAALVADGGQCIMGPLIDRFEIKEPRPKLRDALNSLCEYANNGTDIHYWDITPAKVVRAFIQGTYTAPFSIADANLNGLLESCAVTETPPEANRVFVYLGKYLVDAVTETLHGDGSTRVFNVTTTGPSGEVMAIGAAPSITLNGAAVTVGIDGVETSKQYYYNIESTQIRQDAGETILTGGDDLAVTYQGIDRTTLPAVQDGTAISAESTLQGGGTGYYETYIESNNISAAVDGAALAAAYLDRSKRSTVTFEGATYTAGLRAGQEIDVDIAQLSLTRSMLIQSVTMADQGGGLLLWSFKCIDGPPRADWKKRLLTTSGSSGQSISGVGASSFGSGGSGATHRTYDTVTADTTINEPATATDKALWVAEIEQDSTGGWVVTWGANIYRAPDIDSGVNDPDTSCIVTFVGSSGRGWICIAAQLGIRKI